MPFGVPDDVEKEWNSLGVVQAIHVVRLALPERSEKAHRVWVQHHSKDIDLPRCSFNRAGRPSLAVNSLNQVQRILDIAGVSVLSGEPILRCYEQTRPPCPLPISSHPYHDRRASRPNHKVLCVPVR